MFRLAGPYVAYTFSPHSEFALPILRVVDLRDGRLFRGAVLDSGALDMELKDNGSVAVVTEVGYFRRPRRLVLAFDALGRRLLDSRRGTRPKSLALNGSMLTWVKRGVMRSATLE